MSAPVWFGRNRDKVYPQCRFFALSLHRRRGNVGRSPLVQCFLSEVKTAERALGAPAEDRTLLSKASPAVRYIWQGRPQGLHTLLFFSNSLPLGGPTVFVLSLRALRYHPVLDPTRDT